MRINRRGLIGTITIHGLLLALLILGGLTFADPPPEEEGVLVNFGTDNTGFGSIEPQGDEANQGTPEPQVTEEIIEEAPAYSPPPPSRAETAPADNTQDVEKVKVKEDPKPSAEEIAQQKAETEQIRKAQEEERIRRAEEEQIRQEQLAEQRRIEEERRKQEEQASRINNLGRNTFGRQGVGEQDGSEGVSPGTGTNQGTTTGSAGVPNYSDGSGLGNGPTYGLGTRKAVGQIPLPNVDNCNVTSRIVVTVEIQVDRNGNVVGASVKSATFADNCIWNTVLEAARKTKFTSDQNAAFKQTGWIKYTIEP
ncbi:MAG: energy transducer TonB [Bacteroidales bacterium]|nr:energy transducer TonB [Bacteroidales bacterium]MDT8429989.1 energy transducer TonB [Bacteroidales bacterium]